MTAKLPRYPWDEWLAHKRTFRLRKGKDFQCASYVMGVQVRTAAAKRDLKVSIIIEGDTLIITVKDE